MQLSKLNLLVSWPLQLVLAYILIQAGLEKVQGDQVAIDLFTSLNMEPDGRMIIGVLECLAAVGLIIPGSNAWAAFLSTGILLGALIAHISKIGFEGISYWAIAFVCSVIIVWIRRHQLPFSATRMKNYEK